MIERDRLEWVIEQHYRSIDGHYNQRINTKSWCVTTWIIALLFVSYADISSSPVETALLTLLPIILFWLVEGMQASHMKIMELRVVELEKIWLKEKSELKKAKDLLFYDSHQYQSAKIKFNLFLFALFKMETVFPFYLMLGVINVLVLLFFTLKFYN